MELYNKEYLIDYKILFVTYYHIQLGTSTANLLLYLSGRYSYLSSVCSMIIKQFQPTFSLILTSKRVCLLIYVSRRLS